MKRSILLALLCIATVLPAVAQDTCKIFSIQNPHGADMDITRIWVVDTVNFSVESIRPLPFNLGASESFDIRVCIRSRDGKSHTTLVRYQNTHGTSSYSVTMDAPSTASVTMTEVSGVIRLIPNPASHHLSLRLPPQGLEDVAVRIYSAEGRLIDAQSWTGRREGTLPVIIEQISEGAYLIMVTAGGVQVVADYVFIAR